MNPQIIPFVLKFAIILAIIIIPVLFTLALEKRQREQREREDRIARGIAQEKDYEK